MSDPIRVLHVFAALDSGGVSNYVMNLYRAIDTELIQFDFAMTGGEKSLFDDEVISKGGRIFYFNLTKNFVFNLHSILQDEGPFQAVHSHVFFYSGLVLAEAKKCGVPVRVAHAHNAYTGQSRTVSRIVYEFGMRALMHVNATHLLGCSEKACSYVFGHKTLRNSRALVVPDGIDYGRFAYNPEVRETVRKEYNLNGRYVVGHVGHFNTAKNHEKILTVFLAVCQHRDDAALLLVGDGELEQGIRSRVAELGLEDKVIFAGAHRDVERFYQAMDVFLFPSRYEGFGMAMIEAQASGLCCVASDVVPKETAIIENVAFLPIGADDFQWADSLLRFADLTRTQAEKIKQRYSIDQTAGFFYDIYKT